jgi:hypothetical protein
MKRFVPRSISLVRFVLFVAVMLAASRGAQAYPVILSENFDSVAALSGGGWTLANQSSPTGVTTWFQGNAGVFAAQSGAADSYVAANFLGAAYGGALSEWLITPVLDLKNLDILTFYTRVGTSGFGDRLELRLSDAGAASNIGATETSVGTFTNLLAVIDDNDPLGQPYPDDWAQINVIVSGLAGPTSARLAFRYVASDTSVFADYIGIDSVEVQSVPEPSTLTLSALGLIGAARSWRRRRAARG